MIKDTLFKLGAGFVLTTAFTGFALAQETTTTTTTTTGRTVVQNQDGSWSVIEYPVNKEVMVTLTPTGMASAKGMARVMRMNDGTTVSMDLTGLDNSASNYYVYAVNSNGETSYLGPIAAQDGIGKATFNTPLNQFMLVLSPTQGLTTIDNNTAVMFRSSVPTGYAVVPVRTKADGEKVAVTTEVNSTYQVPMLNVAGFDNKTKEINIKFSGDLEGLKGKAYIDPRKDGSTQIKMRFDDMKMAPKDKRYVLWAVSPSNEYTKIGQVVNTGQRQEGEIRGETAMSDFGLFVTMEDTDVNVPKSVIYAPVVAGIY